jgi:hypothetical protein
MLTLITCTGARPEAFALCERWMQRQTYKGELQWIVVDDGPEPTPMTHGQLAVRPQPRWSPGAITLSRNMLAALPLVLGAKVLFIEDDDYYGPQYLESMSHALDRAALAGQIPARYYNVRSRQYRVIDNVRHASLCQTGIRAEVLQKLELACRAENRFIDLRLWRENQGEVAEALGSLGIKGLPGRPGIGIGHSPSARWIADTDGSWLRNAIGEDAAAYQSYFANPA